MCFVICAPHIHTRTHTHTHTHPTHTHTDTNTHTYTHTHTPHTHPHAQHFKMTEPVSKKQKTAVHLENKFESLPSDLIPWEIFSYLTWRETVNCLSVCKAWSNLGKRKGKERERRGRVR